MHKAGKEADPWVSGDLIENGTFDASREAVGICKEPLWNPSAAVNWSVLFTPIFGAYIQTGNWKTLGDEGQAEKSFKWFVSSIWVLAIYLFLFVAVEDPGEAGQIAQGVWFVYLLAWYFSSGKVQIKYVKHVYGKDYRRKSLIKPVIYGIGGFIAWHALAVLTLYIGWLIKY